METQDSAETNSWIKKIWPVQKYELKKVIPLLFLKFLASIVYATLTCMKDSLIVTADHSGAEVIPVLKGWVVFPLSLLCAIGYSKLSNVFKRSTLFYMIVSFFLLVIFLYGFVLYPNVDILSPHTSANALTAKLGAKFTHWISVYRNWIHSLFFITAELWAQVVIFILYWGFANHICQVKEAKRTYTLFIAAGDLATVVSGPLVLHYVSKFTGGDFTGTLQTLISYVLVAGSLILVTYWWMNRYVLSDKRYFDPLVIKHTLNEKTKLTLGKSVKHIFSSKYLLSIAVLVIGCALTINMVEVTWKAHLKELYPTTADYLAFNSKVTTIVGVVALFTVLLLGGNFLRRFGWRFSAQISPIVIGATGAIFFAFSYFRDSLGPLATLFGATPLMFLVLLGAFQSIASKVVKYSFFDSTKEMAYIPLDQESKVKGKAAIDMVGSRLGKSSSSWLQVSMMALAGTGSVLAITPYLIPIVLGVAFYWSYSVRYLSKELDKKEKALLETEEAAKEEPSSAAEPTPVA
ncbi:MAG: NTP/NDP exchange transporter [Simkaniaceae bacterium]|nr:MAG: NTP/NDP exchange transporter [Simkaniaceae bacterium]